MSNMEITITKLDGSSHTVSVSPQDTVGYLKELLRATVNEPPERLKLIFDNGRRTELSDDSKPVGSYGLQHGSRVSLLITKPATIEVFLRNPNGGTSTYDIKADETVENFKRRVESREGVKVSQQRLNYQGRDMMGGTLSDYNVGMHSTIDLLLRLRGGCGH